jgi:hypothetical protein
MQESDEYLLYELKTISVDKNMCKTSHLYVQCNATTS